MLTFRTGRTTLALHDVYVVDEIFPAYEIHLFIGPSGAGKTTYLFQFLQAWAAGEKIFGYQARPQPYVYISCDRSSRNVRRTLARVGVKKEIPMVSAVDECMSRDINTILKFARAKFPDARVFFIEGLGSLVPGGKLNDYKVVADFLLNLANYCNKEEVTIFGVGHASKTKENERILNPRERILGSVAWAAYSETIFFFEPVDAENPECSLRRLHVLPRNAKQQTFDFDFSTGLLVQYERKAKEAGPNRLKHFIFALPIGSEFSLEEAKAAAGASSQYVHRVLGELRDQGAIKRLGPGRYLFNPPPNLNTFVA